MPAAVQCYRGTVTYDATDSGDQTVASVGPSATNIGKCTLRFTLRDDLSTDRAARQFWTGQLVANASNIDITFSRGASASAGNTTIEWHVTEFAASALEQSVQRGTQNRGTSQTVSITAVDKAASMIFTSWKTDKDTSGWMDESIRYTVDLTTNVTASDQITFTNTTHDDPTGDESTVAWEVAEFKAADVSAQWGTTTFTDSTQPTITAVNTENAVVVQTGCDGGNSSGNRFYARVKFNATGSSVTALDVDDSTHGSAVQNQLSWTVLAFSDTPTIERGETVISDGSATPTQPTFTALVADRTEPLMGWTVGNGYHSETTTDGNTMSGLVTFDLNVSGSDATGLNLERENTTADFTINWHVIEWPAESAGGAMPVVAQQMVRRLG